MEIPNRDRAWKYIGNWIEVDNVGSTCRFCFKLPPFGVGYNGTVETLGPFDPHRIDVELEGGTSGTPLVPLSSHLMTLTAVQNLTSVLGHVTGVAGWNPCRQFRYRPRVSIGMEEECDSGVRCKMRRSSSIWVSSSSRLNCARGPMLINEPRALTFLKQPSSIGIHVKVHRE